eukprot:gnl/MRDRNA2_/MRDRNA2_110551_c0_seq1.p1 gnl/MRDRNA2_/MRDRNA2_110551_c0~~gnl/MRDRNA2_/MRDRNA2_110551_c0_seq1.p1  ORF type:complete len:791 (-),score=134.40 gnl/MRDRNA2_/MRDRNA2_110551_c0_seq1:72-2444(-)
MILSKSLPDLLKPRDRPQTATSLTEAFPGFPRQKAMQTPNVKVRDNPFGSRPSTFQSTAASSVSGYQKHHGGSHASDFDEEPFQGLPEEKAAKMTPPGLVPALQVYFRTRSMVQDIEKNNQRMPTAIKNQLHALEVDCVARLRPLNRELFQCFDDMQLGRALRSMPFFKMSQDKWVFNDAQAARDLGRPEAGWPNDGPRMFLLFNGVVRLYEDGAGAGPYREIYPGSLFGNQHFRVGDERATGLVGGSAQCSTAGLIGVLSKNMLYVAFADRSVRDQRVAKSLQKLPSLQCVSVAMENRWGRVHEDSDEHIAHNQVIWCSLKEMARLGSNVHVPPDNEVLSSEPLTNSFLVVSAGMLQVKADLTLRDRLEHVPPKRVRLKVFIHKAENLQGDSIFDKLDPFCLVKLGSFKRFQTPTVMNAGKNCKWNHQGILKYDGEQILEFYVYDYDKYSSDDLCGQGSLKMKDILDGWEGDIKLMMPKKGMFGKGIEVPGGTLSVSITWDLEYPDANTAFLRERTFEDVLLFELPVQNCWGQEMLMLGEAEFRNVLERAADGLKYELLMGPFRVIGNPRQIEDTQVLKVSKKRFFQFLKYCARVRQMETAVRQSAVEKQKHIKDVMYKLIKKWEHEQTVAKLQGAVDERDKPRTLDPSRFRVAYRGARMFVIVRNALNLVGGGWFDKLDPYAEIKWRGGKSVARTPVLQDAGGSPIWDYEGEVIYEGEGVLEITVWDYDRGSNDDLVGSGFLSLEDVCNGYEGMVNLSAPKETKRKSVKQMSIVIGITWEKLVGVDVT